jgi:phosphopantetheinyl transferase (holo-ACP synthase)
MLGNDVVDLADAAGRHPRFATRVFTPAERALIDSDSALGGVLWAAKESAYKAARKADRATVFSPARFVVDLDGAERATVTVGERRFVVDLVRTADYVHAVACAAGDAPTAACAAVGTVPAGTSDGLAVRRLAVDTLARALGLDGLAIGRDGRIPLLLRHGRPMAADLSLSHHGRFAAFAYVLR